MGNHETSYVVVRETWLTRKPRRGAGFVASLAILFLLAISLAAWSNENIHAELVATAHSVFAKGEYWRLFTATFIHADIGHLIANSFLFFILSFFLYGYFGFFVFPLAVVVLGALANWFSLKTYEPDIQLLGASGMVYAMGGCWLVLYFFLSRQQNLLQRWLRSFGVGLALFAPSEAFEQNISYQTHLAGFALGLVFGGLYFVAHHKTFRSAEVRETVVDRDEDDPGTTP